MKIAIVGTRTFDDYETLKEGILEINRIFTEEAKTKVTVLIKKRENPPYSSRDRKSGSGAQLVSSMTKTELETEKTILNQKKDEFTNLTENIKNLEGDLLVSQQNQADLKAQLDTIKQKITDETVIQKGLKRKDRTNLDKLTLEKQKIQADIGNIKLNISETGVGLKDIKKTQETKTSFIAGLLTKITKLENK